MVFESTFFSRVTPKRIPGSVARQSGSNFFVSRCDFNLSARYDVIIRPLSTERGMANFMSIKIQRSGMAIRAEPNPVTPCTSPPRKNIQPVISIVSISIGKI